MSSKLISKFTISALFVIEENLKEKADFLINFVIPEIFKATKKLNYYDRQINVKNFDFIETFYENIMVRYKK